MRRWPLRRIVFWGALALVAAFALAQAVPYGRAHKNPPVTQEPKWDSPQTRALAVDACFDCHSNETKWPWWSNLAPGSWLIQKDVNGGRDTLNFSEWNRPQDADAAEIPEVVTGGSMPPWYYKILHPNARLSGSEKAALARGLRNTMRSSPPPGGGG